MLQVNLRQRAVPIEELQEQLALPVEAAGHVALVLPVAEASDEVALDLPDVRLSREDLPHGRFPIVVAGQYRIGDAADVEKALEQLVVARRFLVAEVQMVIVVVVAADGVVRRVQQIARHRQKVNLLRLERLERLGEEVGHQPAAASAEGGSARQVVPQMQIGDLGKAEGTRHGWGKFTSSRSRGSGPRRCGEGGWPPMDSSEGLRRPAASVAGNGPWSDRGQSEAPLFVSDRHRACACQLWPADSDGGKVTESLGSELFEDPLALQR